MNQSHVRSHNESLRGGRRFIVKDCFCSDTEHNWDYGQGEIDENTTRLHTEFLFWGTGVCPRVLHRSGQGVVNADAAAAATGRYTVDGWMDKH